MPVLRIAQNRGDAPHRYRIEITATDIPNAQPLQISSDIDFELSPVDGERIRWYFEDYLQFDEDPAPQIARGVEELMAACGEELFRSLFEGTHQGRQLWTKIEPHLPDARVEIKTGIADAAAIPWELIRNPHTKGFLALSVASFVRTQHETQITLAPGSEAEKVRILLVICRPRGGYDVPFRSVAGRLVTRLSDDARDAFDLTVLRPPTYEKLAETLRLARERGRPYHIVHFDGHGVYAEEEALAGLGKVLDRRFKDGRSLGPRGFLVFEDPANQANSNFVDGFRVGALLKASDVPVLVLNACQSAFAEAPARPDQAVPEGARSEIEAYGSLAQAVVEAGAAGVVAMRYAVYVVTAAQFMAQLYGALARGRGLGEAVTWARKNLHDQPERRIAYAARPLQDWSVPLVWERAPLRLWVPKPDGPSFKFTRDDGASTVGELDQALPALPDVGFFGRDETLYALDRAFDTDRIVLLHALAGSGKTSTAAEFARWYQLTGGVEGPVLFSSFEHHLPLARVLDKIGEVFGQALEPSGIHWDAVTELNKRRSIVLQLLKRAPVLWIWDNVEPVTGFPDGAVSDWSAAEQRELRAFLSAARETKAKFLLTSRRDEAEWLGELPRRVPVPKIPMQECLQLAGAIVERRGKRLSDLPDLTPLLRLVGGSPRTILVTMGEALRAGIDSPAQLDKFVADLQRSEDIEKDDKCDGASTGGEKGPIHAGHEPLTGLEYFVSYAWGDDTVEGEQRDAIVDLLCTKAAARGKIIIRDKAAMEIGDRISTFMDRIGKGAVNGRVCIVLSDKYLRSAYCMHELFDVWRNCRENPGTFNDRTRILVLPSAKIATPILRAQYVIYWQGKFDELRDLVKMHGQFVLSDSDNVEFRLMGRFVNETANVLQLVQDILRPRLFDPQGDLDPREFDEYMKFVFD